ncbi:MAG: YchF family ATPase [Leptospirales bacterium]|nr:YchF family ATPase [Leptospirales bacterium]
MELGIIGLPQTGKKSLYQLLTGAIPNDAPDKICAGVADKRDARFDALVKMYKPKKEVPARINLQLLQKIESDSISAGKIFTDISKMDALCHIVRAFEDDLVYHAKGSVDPLRDIEMVNSELILHDLIFIEKRFERIENSRKKKSDAKLDQEEELLNRMKSHLENDLHLRTFALNEEECRLISGYPFITAKEMLIALNVDDKKIGDRSLIEKIRANLGPLSMEVMQVSAKLEGEIFSLDSEEEKLEFMADAGITEPALNQLSELSMKVLGLISFFTVGKDEVRQWLIKKGSPAPVAAGAIHSDIQKGFIRAEVMKYGDLMELGSEDELKKSGKFYVMGKEYIVEEGDIINFRFNV